MKRSRRAACAAVIGVTALGYVAMVGAQQTGAATDEQAIRLVITEMTEGFNSHDGRAASRMYMPEARLVTVRPEEPPASHAPCSRHPRFFQNQSVGQVFAKTLPPGRWVSEERPQIGCSAAKRPSTAAKILQRTCCRLKLKSFAASR